MYIYIYICTRNKVYNNFFFITVSVKISFDQYDDAMVDTPLKLKHHKVEMQWSQKEAEWSSDVYPPKG